MGVRLPPSRQEDLIMYLPAAFDYNEHRVRGSSYCTIAQGSAGEFGLAVLYRSAYRNEILPMLGVCLKF